MIRPQRGTGDRGVTMVEAAFVLPVFMFLILGMIDLGFAGFSTSQATAAARDGARYGILEKLDEAGIEDEVEARLVKVGGVTVDSECLLGLEGNTVIDCAAAKRGQDRIRVTVEWSYDKPTFISDAAGIDTIRGVATMVIVDRPISVPAITTTTAAPTTTTFGATTTTLGSTTTTTAAPTTTTTVPGQCVATGISFNPAPLKLAGGSSKFLAKDTTFTVTTNGADTCTSLRIEYPATKRSAGSATSPVVTPLSPSFQDEVKTNEYEWIEGDNQLFRILNSSGQAIGSFRFPITR